MADKVTLRGFYLGQNKDELSHLPNFDRVYEKFATPGLLPLSSLGLVQLEDHDFTQTSSNRSLGDEYSDIGFHLNFLNDKIMSVTIDYHEYKPKNLSVFVRQISNTTTLPFESWRIDNLVPRAFMKCVDFEVYAFGPSYKSPSIYMVDSIAETELTRHAKESERTRAEAEKERERTETERKKVFRP